MVVLFGFKINIIRLQRILLVLHLIVKLETIAYIDAEGKAMQLEVPADQYEKAVELMEKRIEKGKFMEYQIHLKLKILSEKET